MNCKSGKRCFLSESIAVEALIQNHTFNDYKDQQGPTNVYECTDCGYWHFTSKNEKHSLFDDPEVVARIRKEKQAHYWERKIR